MGFNQDHTTINHTNPDFVGKARQLADRIFDVSVERWCAEIDKLLTSDYPNVGLDYLCQMGVLQRVLPELFSERHNDYESETITWPVLQDKLSKDVDVAWKNLLQNINIPEDIKEPTHTRRYINIGICARLKFSNERTKIILGDK